MIWLSAYDCHCSLEVCCCDLVLILFFFFQAEDGIRDLTVTGVQTCALPISISNRIAPEHLEVSSNDPHQWEPLLRHAGAIFLGAYTSESLGDYCAGPNHVLPRSEERRVGKECRSRWSPYH